MIKGLRGFLLILLLIGFESDLLAQKEELKFTIFHKKKEVGVLDAITTVQGDQIIYSSQTVTTLKLIIDFVIVFDNTVKVKNGIIEYADMSVSVNKKNYGKTVTNLKGKEYVMDKDGDEKIIKSFPITYSATLLVFYEPGAEKESFSEKEGDFHPLKHIGNHVYEKTDHKGRVNTYYYKDGLLEKAEIDAGLISFVIVKAD